METMLILILLSIASVVIFLHQTLRINKSILKDRSFAHINLYSSLLSFLLLKISQVDFLVKFPYVFLVHQGISSTGPAEGMFMWSTMYSTISSYNLLLYFFSFHAPSTTKSITSSSPSSALSLLT